MASPPLLRRRRRLEGGALSDALLCAPSGQSRARAAAAASAAAADVDGAMAGKMRPHYSSRGTGVANGAVSAERRDTLGDACVIGSQLQVEAGECQTQMWP
jgi:hypothetical protein